MIPMSMKLASLMRDSQTIWLYRLLDSMIFALYNSFQIFKSILSLIKSIRAHVVMLLTK